MPTTLAALPLVLAAAAAVAAPGAAVTQERAGREPADREPAPGEVWQLVTFDFLPGRTAEAVAIFEERAIPLYRRNEAMRSFRGFREVESPVPLDLVVVSAFDGMAGMDRSNDRLRELAAAEGTSVGAIYGAIATLASGHTDEFAAMEPALGHGDPTSARLVAFVRYRNAPGREDDFGRGLAEAVVPWEREAGVPSATGRMLLADGWHWLRVLGFDSLGAYEAHRREVRERLRRAGLEDAVQRVRHLVVAPLPALAVR